MSTEHESCLHVLTFIKSHYMLSLPDKVKWGCHESTGPNPVQYIYSGDPCDPAESEAITDHDRTVSYKKNTQLPTKADTFYVNYDGVIGGADF